MQPQTELKRDLGLWSAAAIVVGTVIGLVVAPRLMVSSPLLALTTMLRMLAMVSL